VKFIYPAICSLFLISLLVISGCNSQTEAPKLSETPKFTGLQIKTAQDRAFKCVMGKSLQYARTSGAPFELGMLAANACQTQINEAARVYADGNPRVEIINRQNFRKMMAEGAAQIIVEARTK